jgi:dienelactone hydrolase
VDDDAFLVGCEVAAPDAGAEVVGPSEAAALAAAHEAGVDGHGPPVAGAVLLDVGDEDDVLLRRPWTLLDPHLVAARRPPHLLFSPAAAVCFFGSAAVTHVYIAGQGESECE